MSYARFADDSDVYVYLDVNGYLACCACWLNEPAAWKEGDPLFPPTTKCATTALLLDHLAEHRVAGHAIPTYAIDGLIADADENDAWLAPYLEGD